MLERYLGAERFRDGIRLYLGRHAYGNTETHDLWNDDRGSERRAGAPHHGPVDLAGRVSAAHG